MITENDNYSLLGQMSRKQCLLRVSTTIHRFRTLVLNGFGKLNISVHNSLERKEKKIFFVLTIIWHSGGNVKRKFGIFRDCTKYLQQKDSPPAMQMRNPL